MFDDRLQDIIMQEMMSAFGVDVRTDEGSLAYNACAKIAEKLEEVYGDMDLINSNMLPDTQDDYHLISYGQERGIEYHYATAPIVKGVFNQSIEIGERFYCNDYVYTVTELIDGFNYRLVCETEGVDANANFGELIPVDYVDEYQGGQITEILVAGTDDEDIEIYRKKIIETFHSQAFGGNKADYKFFINAITGVGGSKPKRREADSPWINIHVISSDYLVPSSDLINQIQSAVDPEENQGEGDGMAPICHKVKIYGVEGVDIDVEITVTFDTGYSVETSQSQIESAIAEYIESLRESWIETEYNVITVRVRQIESAVLSVAGVLDVSDTTINRSSENIDLDYTKIPLMGGVVINV